MKNLKAKSSYQDLSSDFSRYVNKSKQGRNIKMFQLRIESLLQPIISIRLTGIASEIIKARTSIPYVEPHCKPLSELCCVIISKRMGTLQVTGYRDQVALAHDIITYITAFIKLYTKYIRKHNKAYNKRLRAQKREGVEYSRATRIHASRLSSEKIKELKENITKSFESMLDKIRLENDKAYYNGSIILKNIELSLNNKYGKNWKSKL
jgi:hypothetical protein